MAVAAAAVVAEAEATKPPYCPSGLAPAPWRYHGRMYRVHKTGYDLETMSDVAAAYRRECQAGRLDGPARKAAVVAFRARHPEIERLPASTAVAHTHDGPEHNRSTSEA